MRSRQAVLAAARSLLQEEGPAAVTHQRVAARAGVGRATVYRHWPAPEQLLREALAHVELPFFAESEGELHGWLRRELRRLADELALPTVRRVTATLVQSAQWDAHDRQQLDGWLATLARRLQRVAPGTSAADPGDPADTAAMLIGPLLYRTLLEGGEVGDAFLDRVLGAVASPGDGSASGVS